MTPALVALALGAAAGGADPCAPAAATTADPRGAAVYREVADAERRAGRNETAAAAYRAAAARDANDARSRGALAELCLAERREGAFERGMALMHAGDDRAAAAAFGQARAEGDPSAALMEGISLYRLHDDGGAAAALRVAERDPDSAASARFFLGLVALRDGRGSDAAALLQGAASTDPQLAPLASSLARVAQREGRLVISAQAESAWDSNVTLAPSGAPVAGRASDGMGGLAAAVRVAPLGESGPYATVSGTHREQLRLNDYDLWGLGAAAGWKLGRDARYAAVEYGFDHVVLGGAPYLDAHRIAASARLDLAPRSSLGLTYLARFEDYRPAAYTDYSGLRHHAEADATAGLGLGWVVTAAYHLGRDGARDASLSWWEHGPRAAVQKHLGPALRLGLEAAGTWRDYDRVDPVLLVRRSDAYADLAAWLEVDLAARFTLRAGVTGRRATSNIPEFTYTRVIPSLVLGWSLGMF